MSDPGNAAIELARTLVEMTKPVVETSCQLIETLLGEPCNVAGGMLADQIYAWRWSNRIRIFHRAKRLMDENKVAPEVLPPGFLVPLLDGAGDVDDADLQEMWARLLHSAVSNPVHRHPAFVHILKQLTPEDARILSNWPTSSDTIEGNPRLPPVTAEQLAMEHCILADEAYLTLVNLERLGVAMCEKSWSGLRDYGLEKLAFFLTIFGQEFVNACLGRLAHNPRRR